MTGPNWMNFISFTLIIMFVIFGPKDQTQKPLPEAERANLIALREYETEARTASAPAIETCFPDQTDRVRRLQRSLAPVTGKTVQDFPGLAGQPAWFINEEGQIQFCDFGKLRPTDQVSEESSFESIPSVGGERSVKLIVIATHPRTFVLYSTTVRPYTGPTRAADLGPPFCLDT